MVIETHRQKHLQISLKDRIPLAFSFGAVGGATFRLVKMHLLFLVKKHYPEENDRHLTIKIFSA